MNTVGNSVSTHQNYRKLRASLDSFASVQPKTESGRRIYETLEALFNEWVSFRNETSSSDIASSRALNGISLAASSLSRGNNSASSHIDMVGCNDISVKEWSAIFNIVGIHPKITTIDVTLCETLHVNKPLQELLVESVRKNTSIIDVTTDCQAIAKQLKAPLAQHSKLALQMETLREQRREEDSLCDMESIFKSERFALEESEISVRQLIEHQWYTGLISPFSEFRVEAVSLAVKENEKNRRLTFLENVDAIVEDAFVKLPGRLLAAFYQRVLEITDDLESTLRSEIVNEQNALRNVTRRKYFKSHERNVNRVMARRRAEHQIRADLLSECVSDRERTIITHEIAQRQLIYAFRAKFLERSINFENTIFNRKQEMRVRVSSRLEEFSERQQQRAERIAKESEKGSVTLVVELDRCSRFEQLGRSKILQEEEKCFELYCELLLVCRNVSDAREAVGFCEEKIQSLLAFDRRPKTSEAGEGSKADKTRSDRHKKVTLCIKHCEHVPFRLFAPDGMQSDLIQSAFRSESATGTTKANESTPSGLFSPRDAGQNVCVSTTNDNNPNEVENHWRELFASALRKYVDVAADSNEKISKASQTMLSIVARLHSMTATTKDTWGISSAGINSDGKIPRSSPLQRNQTSTTFFGTASASSTTKQSEEPLYSIESKPSLSQSENCAGKSSSCLDTFAETMKRRFIIPFQTQTSNPNFVEEQTNSAASYRGHVQRITIEIIAKHSMSKRLSAVDCVKRIVGYNAKSVQDRDDESGATRTLIFDVSCGIRYVRDFLSASIYFLPEAHAESEEDEIELRVKVNCALTPLYWWDGEVRLVSAPLLLKNAESGKGQSVRSFSPQTEEALHRGFFPWVKTQTYATRRVASPRSRKELHPSGIESILEKSANTNAEMCYTLSLKLLLPLFAAPSHTSTYMNLEPKRTVIDDITVECNGRLTRPFASVIVNPRAIEYYSARPVKSENESRRRQISLRIRCHDQIIPREDANRRKELLSTTNVEIEAATEQHSHSNVECVIGGLVLGDGWQMTTGMPSSFAATPQSFSSTHQNNLQTSSLRGNSMSAGNTGTLFFRDASTTNSPSARKNSTSLGSFFQPHTLNSSYRVTSVDPRNSDTSEELYVTISGLPEAFPSFGPTTLPSALANSKGNNSPSFVSLASVPTFVVSFESDNSDDEMQTNMGQTEECQQNPRKHSITRLTSTVEKFLRDLNVFLPIGISGCSLLTYVTVTAITDLSDELSLTCRSFDSGAATITAKIMKCVRPHRHIDVKLDSRGALASSRVTIERKTLASVAKSLTPQKSPSGSPRRGAPSSPSIVSALASVKVRQGLICWSKIAGPINSLDILLRKSPTARDLLIEKLGLSGVDTQQNIDGHGVDAENDSEIDRTYQFIDAITCLMKNHTRRTFLNIGNNVRFVWKNQFEGPLPDNGAEEKKKEDSYFWVFSITLDLETMDSSVYSSPSFSGTRVDGLAFCSPYKLRKLSVLPEFGQLCHCYIIKEASHSLVAEKITGSVSTVANSASDPLTEPFRDFIEDVSCTVAVPSKILDKHTVSSVSQDEVSDTESAFSDILAATASHITPKKPKALSIKINSTTDVTSFSSELDNTKKLKALAPSCNVAHLPLSTTGSSLSKFDFAAVHCFTDPIEETLAGTTATNAVDLYGGIGGLGIVEWAKSDGHEEKIFMDRTTITDEQIYSYNRAGSILSKGRNGSFMNTSDTSSITGGVTSKGIPQANASGASAANRRLNSALKLSSGGSSSLDGSPYNFNALVNGHSPFIPRFSKVNFVGVIGMDPSRKRTNNKCQQEIDEIIQQAIDSEIMPFVSIASGPAPRDRHLKLVVTTHVLQGSKSEVPMNDSVLSTASPQLPWNNTGTCMINPLRRSSGLALFDLLRQYGTSKKFSTVVTIASCRLWNASAPSSIALKGPAIPRSTTNTSNPSDAAYGEITLKTSSEKYSQLPAIGIDENLFLALETQDRFPAVQHGRSKLGGGKVPLLKSLSPQKAFVPLLTIKIDCTSASDFIFAFINPQRPKLTAASTGNQTARRESTASLLSLSHIAPESIVNIDFERKSITYIPTNNVIATIHVTGGRGLPKEVIDSLSLTLQDEIAQPNLRSLDKFFGDSTKTDGVDLGSDTPIASDASTLPFIVACESVIEIRFVPDFIELLSSAPSFSASLKSPTRCSQEDEASVAESSPTSQSSSTQARSPMSARDSTAVASSSMKESDKISPLSVAKGVLSTILRAHLIISRYPLVSSEDNVAIDTTSQKRTTPSSSSESPQSKSAEKVVQYALITAGVLGADIELAHLGIKMVGC